MQVEYRKLPSDWFNFGGEIDLQEPLEDDGKTFFYTKRLEENRFVDIESDSENSDDKCVSCKYVRFVYFCVKFLLNVIYRHKAAKKLFNTPVYNDGCIKWKNNEYKVGTGVFLKPDTYSFKDKNEIESIDSVSKFLLFISPIYII